MRPVRARKVRRLFAGMLAGAVLAFCGVAYAQEAKAVPGQCSYGSGGGFGGGGFCDGPMQPDGTFFHCETVYVLGFGGQNCFFVRPAPFTVDPRGWVPA